MCDAAEGCGLQEVGVTNSRLIAGCSRHVLCDRQDVAQGELLGLWSSIGCDSCGSSNLIVTHANRLIGKV